jgi:hypothetical protein
VVSQKTSTGNGFGHHQNAPPCVKPRRLSHRACLCDARIDRYAVARKNTRRKVSKEKSQSRYISRMCGGALLQPIAMEVCTFVQVTNLINRANLCGCRIKGLVSAKGPI